MVLRKILEDIFKFNIQMFIQVLTPKSLSILGSVFPFLSVVAGWIVYYSLGHNTPGVLLTISETVIPFPECRIFAVTMNMEVIFLYMLYTIRNNAISTLAREKGIILGIKKVILILCKYVNILGLSITSWITLKEFDVLHFSAAGFFFMGSLIYYVVSDMCLAQVGHPVPQISHAITITIPIFLVLYSVVCTQFQFSDHNFMRSMGALFQYIYCFLLFTRIFLFQYDLPKNAYGTIWGDVNSLSEQISH